MWTIQVFVIVSSSSEKPKEEEKSRMDAAAHWQAEEGKKEELKSGMQPFSFEYPNVTVGGTK